VTTKHVGEACEYRLSGKRKTFSTHMKTIFIRNKAKKLFTLITFVMLCYVAGPDLVLVGPQTTVIQTAPYPNYINNFIKILLNAFRVIVILQPFKFFS